MRSQFINMCGYAGDITSAKDRTGIYSALIMVKGGASGTPIMVKTCTTSDGEFKDYVKLADGASDIVKGFFVNLNEAEKYIKVTGATYADVVFGDCDFDPKGIVTSGSVPTPQADLDNNKTKTINVSTYTSPVEILPTSGKDGMKKCTVTLSNIPNSKLFAWKDEDSNIAYTVTETPEAEGDCFLSADTGLASDTIKAVAEGKITVTISETDVDYSRYTTGDIEL